MTLSFRSSVVKTQSSVREIPGSIPTIYEFSVWKESGAPRYKCARVLLVLVSSSRVYCILSTMNLPQGRTLNNTKQQQ